METKKKLENRIGQLNAAYSNIINGINHDKEAIYDVAFAALTTVKELYDKLYDSEVETRLYNIKRNIEIMTSDYIADSELATIINHTGLQAIDILSSLYPEMNLTLKEEN